MGESWVGSNPEDWVNLVDTFLNVLSYLGLSDAHYKCMIHSPPPNFLALSESLDVEDLLSSTLDSGSTTPQSNTG